MEKDDKGSTLIRIGVSGWKFLLVPAYPGCPGSKAVKRSLLLLLVAILATSSLEHYRMQTMLYSLHHWSLLCTKCLLYVTVLPQITVFHLVQRSPNVWLYSLDLSVFCMHSWVNVCFMLMANPLNLCSYTLTLVILTMLVWMILRILATGGCFYWPSK